MRNDAEMFSVASDWRPPTIHEYIAKSIKKLEHELAVEKDRRNNMVVELAKQDESVRRLEAAVMEYSHWLRNNK